MGRKTKSKVESVRFFDFFPTTIYHSKLVAGKKIGNRQPDRGSHLRRDLLKEAHTLRQIDGDGVDWSFKNYVNGYTSYGSMDRLNQSSPNFQELEKYLDRHVDLFAKRQHWNLGGGELQMSSCWVNIMPAGAGHSLHLHPLSVVSGTYYVDVPKGSSPLKFEDPRLERFMAQPPRKEKAPREIKPFVELSPKTGDVILFESWLRHEVPTLPSDFGAERISISFNYDWR